jgi:stage V sporulation protein SpoVS
VVPLPPGSLPPHVADPSVLLSAHLLSVASATDPKVLAGAIAGQARAGSVLAVRAIGAKAVFEMLRAVGVARDYLRDDRHGQDLVCFPDFVEVAG